MGCNHDCDSCGGSCGEPESLLKAPHPLSKIKKVIGVVSGKGGVGKSMVTSLLAVAMQRQGAHCGILDPEGLWSDRHTGCNRGRRLPDGYQDRH